MAIFPEDGTTIITEATDIQDIFSRYDEKSKILKQQIIEERGDPFNRGYANPELAKKFIDIMAEIMGAKVAGTDTVPAEITRHIDASTNLDRQIRTSDLSKDGGTRVYDGNTITINYEDKETGIRVLAIVIPVGRFDSIDTFSTIFVHRDGKWQGVGGAYDYHLTELARTMLDAPHRDGEELLSQDTQ